MLSEDLAQLAATSKHKSPSKHSLELSTTEIKVAPYLESLFLASSLFNMLPTAVP